MILQSKRTSLWGTLLPPGEDQGKIRFLLRLSGSRAEIFLGKAMTLSFDENNKKHSKSLSLVGNEMSSSWNVTVSSERQKQEGRVSNTQSVTFGLLGNHVVGHVINSVAALASAFSSWNLEPRWAFVRWADSLIDPVEPGVSVCPLNRHSVLPLTYLSYMQYSLILSIVYYFIFK